MPNVFLHLPDNLKSPPTRIRPRTLTLLYFIPGNPGLIEYYIPFLTLLAKKSEKWTGTAKSFGIAGVSLGGFEATPASTQLQASNDSSSTDTISNIKDQRKPDDDLLSLYPLSFPRKQMGTYTLREQIELTYARLTTLVQRLQSQGQNQDLNTKIKTTAPLTVEIILAGHSVGAYIALEVINLQHKHHQDQHEHQHPPPPSPPPIHLTFLQTHLLTPTILNISHSPSGTIITPLLSYLPFLPFLLNFLSRSLTTLPASVVKSIVRRVTGMKSEEAVNVTVEFLGRAGAVRQALDLAGWEMKEIGEGTWDAAVWRSEIESESDIGVHGIGDVDKDTENGEEARCGDTTGKERESDGENETQNNITYQPPAPAPAPPTHHFLFAKSDHWVADETRSTIIKTMNGRAKIIVDEGELGLVHAWCLEQNEMIADIVSGWIDDMLLHR